LLGEINQSGKLGTGMASKPLCVRSAGHASSRASSPGKSPRGTVVGTYDLEGLAISWDNNPTIRERIRASKNLCLAFDVKGEPSSGYVDPTVENIKLNSCVLLPVLSLMKGHGLQLPSIDKLISTVDEFFSVAKLSRTREECYQEAWAIRRMIVRSKKLCYRHCPPQD